MRTMHGVRATPSFLAGSLTWTRNGLQARILPYPRSRWVKSCQVRVQFLFNPSLTRRTAQLLVMRYNWFDASAIMSCASPTVENLSP
jgi:hypothetical protein